MSLSISGKPIAFISLVATWFVAAGTFAESAQTDTASGDSAAVYEPMAIYAQLAGKAWRGEGTGPDGKPITDIAVHEYILGGRAFQSTHRLEGGDYGGRTIFFYDEGAKKHIFHYFTTAGFHTVGEITPTEDGFISVEEVKGHPKYVEVRSRLVYDGDELRAEISHVDQNGDVTESEGFVYREISQPPPLFPAGGVLASEEE